MELKGVYLMCKIKDNMYLSTHFPKKFTKIQVPLFFLTFELIYLNCIWSNSKNITDCFLFLKTVNMNFPGLIYFFLYKKALPSPFKYEKFICFHPHKSLSKRLDFFIYHIRDEFQITVTSSKSFKFWSYFNFIWNSISATKYFFIFF